MGIVDNLMTHPATIIRRDRTGTLDDHGVPMVEAASGVTTVCYLDQAGVAGSQRVEENAGREYQELGYTGFFPATADLDGTDAVVVDGITYEVVGPPWYARDPLTDTVDHVELNLRVGTG